NPLAIRSHLDEARTHARSKSILSFFARDRWRPRHRVLWIRRPLLFRFQRPRNLASRSRRTTPHLGLRFVANHSRRHLLSELRPWSAPIPDRARQENRQNNLGSELSR